jgi:hypothetical protein
MNTKKTIYEMSKAINTRPLVLTKQPLFNRVYLPIYLTVAISLSLGLVTKPVKAETAGAEDIQHYRNANTPGIENTAGKGHQSTNVSVSKDSGAKKISRSEQDSEITRQTEPVRKSVDGKGALPTFAQADMNGDHYITKDELKNFPYLLQVFDKVDAGKDGKLEQHEYQNLKMETKREGEVS